ncbi:MAG: PAS domain S-box protein [Desulforhopalus sp.]|nr:PAS domain S-box protein [Desulforhopalus sp.]
MTSKKEKFPKHIDSSSPSTSENDKISTEQYPTGEYLPFFTIFENIAEGVACCRIILDNNDKPVDFKYLYVNAAFKRLPGLTELFGKRSAEVIPGIEEAPSRFFEACNRVALSGGAEKFKFECKPSETIFSVSVFSDKKRYFTAVFEDITASRHLAKDLNIIKDKRHQKHVEQDVLESEERYRLLFDSSLDAILLTAPDGSIYGANPSTCRMFQRSEEEIKQIGRSGLVDTSDPRLARALAERQQTGNFAGELVCIRKDGTKFPGEVFTSVFKDRKGNARTSMIIRDITKRKLVEEEVRLSEETLRKAQRVGKMSSWRYIPAGISGDWTKEKFLFLKQEGAPSYERYADIFCSVHPDDSQMLYKAMEKAIFQGIDFELQLRIIRPTGGIGYIHTVCDVSKDEQGNATELIGTTQDISAIKTIQQKLENAEERYRTVVEDQTELISRFSSEGFLNYANPAYCKFFNIKFEELSGRRWQPVAFEDDRQMIEQQILHLTPANPVVTVENRVYKGDGSIRWIQFINRGIFNKADKLVEIQSVGRDISDLKEIQLSLQQKDQELSEKNRKLEKLNIALEVVIEQKNEQLDSLRSDIVKQYSSFVKPHLEELKDISENWRGNQYLKLIEQGMQHILTPFAQHIMSLNNQLSPMEIQVATLITRGETINGVAKELKISAHTVKYHRKNIRFKLGIKNKKINLRSYLLRDDTR